MYALIENNQFVRWVNLRADYPEISFPRNPKPEDLPQGVVIVATPNPNIVAQTFEVVETLPQPQLQEGVWTLAFQARLMTEAERVAKVEQIKQQIVYETQQRLDQFAQTRNYDGILSACTYATSAIAKFQQEGQYCVNLRDQTWAALYELLAEVEQGTKPMPESFQDVEPLLPQPQWPN